MVKVKKPWIIIPRPLIETLLNNHVQDHLVPRPLVLHGPRGVGKTTLILKRLLGKWNSGPHVTGYVDLANSIADHHTTHGHPYPWDSWSKYPSLPLSTLRTQLETCLESMALKGIKLSAISSHQIFTTLNKCKWNDDALTAVLKHILSGDDSLDLSTLPTALNLWERAVCAASVRLNAEDNRESLAALELSKVVIRVQQEWRQNAIKNENQTGGVLRYTTTDWTCYLLKLLSSAAQVDYFQPKLVINNIEVLKNAELTASASTYHDMLIWTIAGLGINERCLPIILVTSDSYYSYRAYTDFGFPDIEMFEWTPAEVDMHLFCQYFSQSQWDVIVEVLGLNPRHLSEVYALKPTSYSQKLMNANGTFEDTLETYLAYLQSTVVNPAMDRAFSSLSTDALCGRIPKHKLHLVDPYAALWKLMDYVEDLIKVDFELDYLTDCSIFDDPFVVSLIEVGLLYIQRDQSLIRPVSRGIERCLVRWFYGQAREKVLKRMQFRNLLPLLLQPDYEFSEAEAFSVALVDFISSLVRSQVAIGSNVPLSSPSPVAPEVQIDETIELSDENPSTPSGGEVTKNEEFQLIKNLQFALVALEHLLTGKPDMASVFAAKEKLLPLFECFSVPIASATNIPQLSLSVLSRLTTHAPCLKAMVDDEYSILLLLQMLHSSPNCREGALHVLCALASTPELAWSAAKHGGVVYILELLLPLKEEVPLQQRASAASLLGKLVGQPMHGPRVAITLAKFLPNGLVSIIRDGPGEAVVSVLDQTTETPELVWTPAMAASLSAQVATMASDLHREQMKGRVVDWDVPEQASGHQDMRDEPQVGGINVRL